jgi:protein arginine kinase activator
MPMSDDRNPVQPAPGDALCDNCHKNPPEHLVTDVDKEGRKVEVRLCVQCARDRGLLASEEKAKSVASLVEELKNRVEDDDRTLVCPQCRLSYADFKKTLRLGCEECYTAFSERLTPILKRIHNATRHAGHVPPAGRDATRDFELQRLRRELRKAIQDEDYERAASVRDRIRDAGGTV